MLVLHGSWLLPTQPVESGRFLLWAETSEDKRRHRGRKPRILPHPFAAAPETVQQALATLAPLPDEPATTRLIALLPAAGEPAASFPSPGAQLG